MFTHLAVLIHHISSNIPNIPSRHNGGIGCLECSKGTSELMCWLQSSDKRLIMELLQVSVPVVP